MTRGGIKPLSFLIIKSQDITTAIRSVLVNLTPNMHTNIVELYICFLHKKALAQKQKQVQTLHNINEHLCTDSKLDWK